MAGGWYTRHKSPIWTSSTSWANFWAVAILVTFLDAAIFCSKAQRHIEVHPELREGYRTLIKGFVTWTNLPWIVMGIGCVYGGVPSVYSFFRPRDGNPYVLAFFCSVFLLWFLGTYWLVFRGGAQKLIDHPGLLNFDFKRPGSVIVIWLLRVLGGITGVILMFSRDWPISPR
ncbi:MAG TPA: hypothetical protein VGI46_06475 [Candidatus Acidoferrum sp.]|jgi:hypothetical protein